MPGATNHRNVAYFLLKILEILRECSRNVSSLISRRSREVASEVSALVLLLYPTDLIYRSSFIEASLDFLLFFSLSLLVVLRNDICSQLDSVMVVAPLREKVDC